MAWVSLPSLALLAAVHIQWLLNPNSLAVQAQALELPAQAQLVDQRTFNVLPNVLPSTVVNGTQVFMPPGVSPEDLMAKPFHVYDHDFLAVIGSEPTLTLIAEAETDPLYHEAVVW
jgi:gluconolactonase